jgi:hypothetical protein
MLPLLLLLLRVGLLATAGVVVLQIIHSSRAGVVSRRLLVHLNV